MLCVKSCFVGGILQESADDWDVGQEVAVAIAIVAIGRTPGVGVEEVPNDGNVVGVEQIAGAAAGTVAVAAEKSSDDRDVGEIEATTATVAIATQEITNNWDVVQIEGAAASTVTVAVAIAAEEVSDDGDPVEVEVSDDGEVVEEALRGGCREDRARGEEGD